MGGNSSAEVKTKKCDNCQKPFNIYVPNACQQKFCLPCFWNHFQVCSVCFTVNEPSVSKEHQEIQEVFKLVKSQMESKGNLITTLENLYSKSEHDLEALSASQKEEINTLTEEIERLQIEFSKTTFKIADAERMTEKQKIQINTLTDEIKRHEVTALKMISDNATLKQKAKKLRLDKAKIEKYRESDLANSVRLEKRIAALEQENEKLKSEAVKLPASSSEILLLKEERKLVGELDKKECTSSKMQILTVNPKNSNRSHYFFEIKHNEKSMGKIVIKPIPDHAPVMCRVFHDYVNGKGGIYLGSKIVKTSRDKYIVFQNATVKGISEMYCADKNDLEIKKGAVGMRVQGLDSNGQKLVKSQFYVLLTDEVPSDGQFSYVFGYVVEGLDICQAISQMDPCETIMVADLGISNLP